MITLRCPHCGNGRALTWTGRIPDRCSGCNLRFKRGDQNYFSGSMFVGLLMGEFIFAIGLLIVVVAMWPDVPWDTITWAAPLAMLAVLTVVIPVSRVWWLALDILLRPVAPDETR
jgi:uncharacterized protein (DUF983 family)